MRNAYIIDFFLSGMLFVMIFYAYVDILSRLNLFKAVIDPHTLSIAIGEYLKRSVVFSGPLIVFLLFLLWRFYHAIITAQAWGYGAAGLLAILGFIGIAFTWLDVLLACISHSKFIDASKMPMQAKGRKQSLLASIPIDTPLSEVGIK
ncbi:hypothetical protein [Psychrobacter sp.]|uniref:hypothetical protein n=1 Tax=Psychrobacter sp. TaxID=56811 RepID=UPI002600EBA4|nr:hypothetical protein [Psychrobacter sp.]